MKTDRHKLLAALVRSFFDAFSSGVIDNSTSPSEEKRQPKNVKQAMLAHYERIAPAFLDTLFFPLSAMNFSYEEMERVVREAQRNGDDMMALVRKACASDAFYEAMVAEYKRNFASLLGGGCPSVADHLASYTRGEAEDGVETDRAIELTVRVVMHGYARGLTVSGENTPHFRQVTLFRLLLDAMNVLLCDAPADYSDCRENLTAMFYKVCGSEHHFSVMTEEMDRTHREIVG